MAKNYFYIISVYILMQFSVFLGVPYLMKQTSLTPFEANGYWSIFSFTIGLIVILLLMRPAMTKNLDRNATTASTTIGWIILGVFIAYFTQFASVWIETMILGIKTNSENTAQILELVRAAPLFIVIPALIAPILEEVIFRKIIFGSLYKKTGFFIAALISAVLFGIIHGEPQHLLIYASMGFVFAYLYVKTKRIIVPIAVHMTLNSISVIVQYNMSPEDIERMQRQAEALQMILVGGSYF